MLRHLGLNPSLTKHLAEFGAEEKLGDIKSSILSTLGLEMLFTGSVSLILIALSGWLSTSFFGSLAAESLLIIICIWFFTTMLIQFFSAIFRGFRDMVGRSIGKVSRMVVTLTLAACLALFLDLDLTGTALAYLFGSTFAAFLCFVILRRRHFDLLKGKGSLDISLAKKLFAFGLPLILASVAGTVIGRTDTLMITGFRSLADVGFYQVARPAARSLGFIGSALSAPILPLVSELWSNGEVGKIRSALSILSKLSILIAVPAALVFMAFPEVVIRVLFGSEYLAGATALRILSVGAIFRVARAGFGPTLTGTGHPTLVLKAVGSAAVFNVFANLLLVPPFGAGGAATATSLSFLISLAFFFHYGQRVVGFSIPIKSILKILTGGGLMLGVILVLKSLISILSLLELFVVMIPSLAFYVVWVCRTGAVTHRGLDLLDRSTPLPRRVVETLRKLVRESTTMTGNRSQCKKLEPDGRKG